MKSEKEIKDLATQQVKNHLGYVEDCTDYHYGLFNGYVEGFKAAQALLCSKEEIHIMDYNGVQQTLPIIEISYVSEYKCKPEDWDEHGNFIS